jgi:hypothetical protein
MPSFPMGNSAWLTPASRAGTTLYTMPIITGVTRTVTIRTATASREDIKRSGTRRSRRLTPISTMPRMTRTVMV